MLGTCSIIFDKDKSFISFARINKSYLNFLGEFELPISCKDNNFLTVLRKNSEIIEKKIKEVENEHSFHADMIFFGLPWDFNKSRIEHETIPLRRRKKITSKDISFAKKQLEDKFLDWDDFCIHNIVLDYKVEGINYEAAPLGVLAKRIQIKSLLMTIKDKALREAEAIFNNSNRHFAGFVAYPVAAFSTSFVRKETPQILVSVGYDKSYFIARSKGKFILSSELDFGLKKVIKKVAKRFSLSFSLAEEIFERYISFKEIPYFKEVTVKKEEGYLKFSTKALNSFIKGFIGYEVNHILDKIKEEAGDEDFIISFIGRLNAKEGFYGFLKDIIPYTLKPPIQRAVLSHSFGCLRYGTSPFLEREHRKEESLLQRIVNVYKEYF